MVFPVESEDRTLRNLLMMCQDHARLVVEIYRKILIMIDILVKKDSTDLSDMLKEVEKIQLESIEIKRRILRELHESASVLFNREDLYRLISKAGEVIDHIESIGVRLWAIEQKKWKIPEQLKDQGINVLGIPNEDHGYYLLPYNPLNYVASCKPCNSS